MQSQRPCSIFSRRSLISAMPCETGETREIGRQILATVKENQGIDQIDGWKANKLYIITNIPMKIAFCVSVRLLSKPNRIVSMKRVGKIFFLRVQDDEDSHSQRSYLHSATWASWSGFYAQLLHMTPSFHSRRLIVLQGISREITCIYIYMHIVLRWYERIKLKKKD